MQITIDEQTMQSRPNWGAKGTERIIQNVVNIISTFKYEVAYDRLIGISKDIIDMPADQILGVYTSEIINIVNTYEPRAKVLEIIPTNIDSDGNMKFKVVIEV